ncbi:Lysine-specific demethylase 6A [Cichlidogyrus casuarinus]|uniref:Lysine-specific demethylase 6A n=1 Tax=Cichlidogyrus casuarinus TaxID=1844966 RepID=A0ABD2Q9U0_9PLAT
MYIIIQAVEYFDLVIIQLVSEIESQKTPLEKQALLALPGSDRTSAENSVRWQFYQSAVKNFEEIIDPKIYLWLGHFQLLLQSYDNALSAYTKYEQLCPEECLVNTSFLYGLAICYFHFNAFSKSAQLFHNIIYIEPSFIRSKEVFIRLGYIYKLRKNIEIALKCFKLALRDKSVATFTNIETWIHHTSSIKQIRLQSETDLDVRLLLQAIDLDNTDGKTWYLLGRCQASLNRVQDAFSAYRSSIDKTEASADTWCSIGVLYQEQSQPMDALQAYFCAVQLDKCHVTAWANLGTLYETMQQYKEALKCYTNAVNSDKKHEVCYPLLASKTLFQVRDEIRNRLSTLQNLLSRMPERFLSGPTSESQEANPNIQPLPSVEEAWSLPIPAQLTQRQLQLILQEVSGNPGKSVVANTVSSKFKKALAAAIKLHEAVDIKPSLVIIGQEDLNKLADSETKRNAKNRESNL